MVDALQISRTLEWFHLKKTPICVGVGIVNQRLIKELILVHALLHIISRSWNGRTPAIAAQWTSDFTFHASGGWPKITRSLNFSGAAYTMPERNASSAAVTLPGNCTGWVSAKPSNHQCATKYTFDFPVHYLDWKSLLETPIVLARFRDINNTLKSCHA